MSMAEAGLPRVVVAVGNPLGANPSASLRAALDPEITALCRPILAGDMDVLHVAAAQMGGAIRLQQVGLFEEGHVGEGVLCVVDRAKHPLTPRPTGPLERAGERMLEDLDAALQMLLFGRAEAAVIAPLAMEAVQAAGFQYQDLGSLIGEWLRLEASVPLPSARGNPLVRVAKGVPKPIVVAAPEDSARSEQLFLSLKEALRIATALVDAPA